MYRISKMQRECNIFLDEIDNYLYYNEITEVENDKIIFTKDMQKLCITENFRSFADITTSIQDLLKLQDITVLLINAAGEEKEVMIEIEGGI